jgi:hypothetical protein
VIFVNDAPRAARASHAAHTPLPTYVTMHAALALATTVIVK